MPDFTPSYVKQDFTPQDSAEVQSQTLLNPVDSFMGSAAEAYRTGTGMSAAFSLMEGTGVGVGGSPVLQPEEANKDFPADGLQFNEPIQMDQAALMQQRKIEENKAKDIESVSSLGVVGSFAAGLTGTLFDPIDFGLNFVTGPTKLLGLGEDALKAKTLAQRALIRAGQGAIMGSTGGVISGGIDWASASQEQRDYGLNDFLQNVAFGTVMGTTLHVPLGALGDAVSKGSVIRKINSLLPADSQVEALKLANQGVYNFDDILGIQPPVVAKELQLGRQLSTVDRLKVIHGIEPSDTLETPQTEVTDSGETQDTPDKTPTQSIIDFGKQSDWENKGLRLEKDDGTTALITKTTKYDEGSFPYQLTFLDKDGTPLGDVPLNSLEHGADMAAHYGYEIPKTDIEGNPTQGVQASTTSSGEISTPVDRSTAQGLAPTPEQVAQERGNRIKSLIGDSGSLVSIPSNQKTPLTSDDIAKVGSDIHDANAALEKETADLDSQVADVKKTREIAETPEEKTEETPTTEKSAKDVAAKIQTPIDPEISGMIEAIKSDLDKAQSYFAELGDREKGVRAVVACALNAII